MKSLPLALIVICFSVTARATSVAPQFWELTRLADVVAVGTAQRSGDVITFSITTMLKGDVSRQTLTFPAVDRSRSNSGRGEPSYFFGPPEEFDKGEPCLVFLESAGGKLTLREAFLDRAEFKEAVADVVRLDALPDEESKVKLLINYVIGDGAWTQYHARDELQQNYDKEQYLDLFEKIAADPDSRSWFVQLLSQVEGSKARDRLLQVLKEEHEDMQLIAIAVLSQRDMADEELTQALIPFLKHKNASLRSQVIVALDERGEHSVAAQVAEALSDPDPMVRGTAANWPWYDESLRSPEIIEKLRELTHDENESVRSYAGSALIKAGDAASFYSLWWQSLVDTDYVRRSLPLDLLVESRPLESFLMLAWPTVLAYAIAVRSRRRRQVKRPALPVVGLVVGYAAGVAIGYCLGEYRATNPFLHAVILTPAVTVPLCLLGGVALDGRRQAKSTESSPPEPVPDGSA